MSLETALSFYTADENLCEYEKDVREKSKNQEKLLQFGTPAVHRTFV